MSLLNFQQVEKKVFGGQLAFNVLPEPEFSAATERRILNQLDAIFGQTFPKPSLHAVQVPVFHSHAFSMFINVANGGELAGLFAKNPTFEMHDSSESASPVGVVSSDKIHLERVRSTSTGNHVVWAVADNLRIAASNAIQTAEHIMLAPALDA